MITLKSLLREDAPTPSSAITKAAKGLSDSAKKLLMVYGTHARNCQRPGGPTCTCGWEQLYHALTGKYTN